METGNEVKPKIGALDPDNRMILGAYMHKAVLGLEIGYVLLNGVRANVVIDEGEHAGNIRGKVLHLKGLDSKIKKKGETLS